MKKAVVLLSGGLDSATALWWAKKRGLRPVALSVAYGQRHAREARSARALARRAKVALHETALSLPWLKSSVLLGAGRLPDVPLSRIGKGGIPPTYVPGRNTIFLALAASLADALGADAVVIGANQLDYSGYPDCRGPYLSAFQRAARLGTRRKGMKVLAPLLRLDKAAIARLAKRLGVPTELTWSCYAGGKQPCGKCDSCKLRAKGFASAGFADPAL